jgi:prepilin-type N-terminal cleavage/methylation domain-containing protein
MNTIIYRTKRDKRKNSIFFGFQFPHSVICNGFTLIELLVVMSIMVLLVAASVPLLKPMFESQKTKNAAQTVAAALQRVRFKAMEEQATYGITFTPFENNPVAVQMRLVKMGNSVLNSQDYRVQIFDGEVFLYESDSTDIWKLCAQTHDAWTDWNSHVQAGYEIQIGRQGRFYKLDTVKTLAPPYDKLRLPEDADGNTSQSVSNAMEYLIAQPPRTTLTPPVVLPRGTVIDLTHSAGCFAPEDQANYNKNKLHFNGSIQNILFTPNGYIDFFNGNYNPYYGGLIYLCIGEWERGLDPNLAEDGKNNIETMTNFWVTLNPQTGQVRVTEMAPILPTSTTDDDKLRDARKFAAEHFGINDQ